MAKFLIIAEEQERKIAEEIFPDIPVIVAGVGAFNIMKSLRDLPLDSELYNVGYAGSANYPIGSIVAVNSVRLNHPNVNYPEPEYAISVVPAGKPYDFEAVCYTGVDFCLHSDYKDCVFDMELAFIAGLGFKKVHSVKLVSDNLSLHEYREVGAGVEEATKN